MKKKKISLTAQTIIIISVLLLIANTALGFVLTNQSKSAIRDLLSDEMSTVASISAEMIDGDMFRTVIEQDGDPTTEEYKVIKNTLDKMQKIIDSDREEAMEYIYSAVKLGEENYIFVIDPDPEDPAPFGKKVVVTDALRTAGNGEVGVDPEPYSDEWGTYYSAYCPIFNSKGEQVGVIGVDFNAKYYSHLYTLNAFTILGACVISGIVGAVIVVLFTFRIRRRFHLLYTEFSSLADDIADLTEGYTEKKESKKPSDPLISRIKNKGEKEEEKIDSLVSKIHHLQKRLRAYIAHVEKQAKTDPMTGVNNKTVYLEKVAEINRKIRDHSAVFSVAVFDINSLKMINDNFGHELGDRSIIESVNVMKSVFGTENLYRIGGDEFIAVMENASEEDIREKFSQMDDKIRAYNETADKSDAIVSFSRGCSAFDPELDKEYRLVFKRADQDLYRDKAQYYKNLNSDEGSR